MYWCTADVGWVTGHSYIVYGPLSCGATCMMYEGAPNFPDWSRFWNIIERHGVTILYTAPTAIRAFIRAGDEWPRKHDLSSLRLLGSVGEPINPEAWMWYHRVIGGERCPIVDTWWQTETGSIMLTTLPGAAFTKPGSTGLPFFGVDIAVVKDKGDACAPNEGGKLVIRKPWPSMARTLWGDDERYRKTYWERHRRRVLHGRRRALRRGRVLLGRGAHRRRAQRRGPPHRHGGDRERAREPPVGRRGGRRGTPRRSEGPGARASS